MSPPHVRSAAYRQQRKAFKTLGVRVPSSISKVHSARTAHLALPCGQSVGKVSGGGRTLEQTYMQRKRRLDPQMASNIPTKRKWDCDYF